MRKFLAILLVCTAAFVSMTRSISAFGVAPAILDLSGGRGETVEATITLLNTSAAEQTYYLDALKFAPREDSDTPEFIPYDVDHSGLPEWIHFASRAVRVAANSKGDVPFSIAIPSSIASGSYYGAVIVSDSPSEVVATNGATISAKTAVLLFLTVTGETLEKLQILDFTSDITGKFVQTVSGNYHARIQNQGNVVLQPNVIVSITDMFGNDLGHVDLNEDKGRILPDTTRTFDLSVESDATSFGPITATLNVESESGGVYATSSLTYWIVSWKPIAVLAIVLAALLILLKKKK